MNSNDREEPDDLQLRRNDCEMLQFALQDDREFRLSISNIVGLLYL